MASTTVAQLAAELNRSAAVLLEQLQSAGVSKASTNDSLTESDKERLLDHLRTAHGTVAGAERKKITLTRKSTSEIKQADSSGKARTIQVEVRKKRTFVKRDDALPVVEVPAEPVIDESELERREEQAKAQAELLRRQEADLAETRRLREEQEARDREAAAASAREAAAKLAAEQAAAAARAATAPSSPADSAKTEVPAAVVVPAPVEPARPALRVIKAADVVDEEKQRAADLAKRRKAAEEEASAIRAMMNAPKKVLVAKKPEEPKPAVEIKGTIHKKVGVPGAPGTTALAKPGDKAVKSEKLSSSWADDAKKRSALKPGARAPAGGNRPGWRAPRAGRRGDRNDGAAPSFVAPQEFQVQEVHVPETISVADLAHKMSVKASEVIKQLMKLGQMVTINQQL
ncbi:MAG: translation initiation factor IF-2 N-terminal domain-containing protein, partial [Burkholderiales bacterium]|nr:translation initiation factor IF-2 N-terminal domain-containing protein [Burkholderiales bacterium]